MATENTRISDFERRVRVVPRSGWVTLGAIAAVVTASVAWSFAGTLPTLVSSRCILLSSSGIVDVPASAAGQIIQLSIKAGEQVRVGQVIGQIGQPEIEDRVHRAEGRVQELQARLAQVQRLSRLGFELSEQAMRQRRSFLGQQKEQADSRVRIADEQLDSARQLEKDGLVTRRSLEDAERESRAARVAAADVERQLRALAGNRTETEKREADERATIELELDDARRDLAALVGDRGRSTAIVSPFEGRVIEVKAGRGILVTRDAPVVSLERSGSSDSTLEAVMYVAASDGKRIPSGASARIVPATARKEEHGYVSGRVLQISDYPSTPQSLVARLGNEDLVQAVAPFAAPFEVRVALDQADGSPRWSRASDTAPKLAPGTLCAGDLIVRKERPIGFVIPALKREIP